MTIEPAFARVRGRSPTLPPIPNDYERLELLYELQIVLARSGGVAEACELLLPIMTRALRVRTVVVVDVTAGSPRVLAWVAEGLSPAAAERARAHAHARLAPFIPAHVATATMVSTATLPGGLAGGAAAAPFITIPLAVACGPVFGVFQLEGATAFDERDLLFVNAAANQLALALDSHHTKTALEVARHAAQDANRRLTDLNVKALAAVRARDTVLGVVSHDLRGPLHTIQMCTELLASGELARPVATIARSVDTMLRLIDDLRDVGSIESGHLSIEPARVDASVLVRDALDSVRGAAAKAGVELEAEVPAHAMILECDRVRIVQVLTNLLSNALKFTRADDRVTLSVTEGAERVRFAVEDTGCGIPEADLAHVFDRYWQARATAHLGTGLGLAIARGIVEAHGGALVVESRVGRGTTFSFALPPTRAGHRAVAT